MADRSVPWIIVALISLLLVTTAAVMALASLALAGDGSYYLVRILGTEDVFGSDTRAFGNTIRQAPVLVGARLGLTDTYVLSVLLGVGQLVVPATVWCIALILARTRATAFSAVALTAGLCAGTTWYFSVEESVFAVPLTALVAVLLWLPSEWLWRHAALAISASLTLVASYEAVVLTGPAIAAWAAWRCASSRSAVTRLGTLTVSATATISIVAGYAGIALGRDQPHAQSLLYFVVSVEPWQFYLALTSSAALIAAMMLQANRAWPILLGTGAVGTAAATYTFTPSAAEAFAARGGAAIAVLALELFLFWLWASDRRRTKPTSEAHVHAKSPPPRWFLVAPVALVAGLAYVNIQAVERWSRSLSVFRAEVESARGLTYVDDVVPDNRRQVVWGWTGTSLSLIVRRSAETYVLVDRTPSFVPFPPMAARQQLADKYTWQP